jgi:hypothetical protein
MQDAPGSGRVGEVTPAGGQALIRISERVKSACRAKTAQKNAAGIPAALGNTEEIVGRSDHFDAAMGLVEFNGAVFEGKEGPVATGAYVFAGMQLGATLTDEDVASEDGLAAEFLHAEPL